MCSVAVALLDGQCDVSFGIKQILRSAQRNEWLSVTAIAVVGRDLTLRFEAAPKKRSRLKRAWIVSCRQVRDLCLADFDGGGINHWARDHPTIWQFSSPRASLAISFGNHTRAECLGVLLEAHHIAVDDWIEFDRFADIDRKTSAGPPKIVAPQFLLAEYRRRLVRAGFSAQLTKPRKRFYWSGRGWSLRRSKVSMLHFGNSFIIAESFTAIPADRVDR
jgi:hypothetical protein